MCHALNIILLIVQYSQLPITFSVQTRLIERRCLYIYLLGKQLGNTVVRNEELGDSECQFITIFAFVENHLLFTLLVQQ